MIEKLINSIRALIDLNQEEEDGEEKTYNFGQENNFVCNYESFLPQTPSTKIIQALEDCEILQISLFLISLQQGPLKKAV